MKIITIMLAMGIVASLFAGDDFHGTEGFSYQAKIKNRVGNYKITKLKLNYHGRYYYVQKPKRKKELMKDLCDLVVGPGYIFANVATTNSVKSIMTEKDETSFFSLENKQVIRANNSLFRDITSSNAIESFECRDPDYTASDEPYEDEERVIVDDYEYDSPGKTPESEVDDLEDF